MRRKNREFYQNLIILAVLFLFIFIFLHGDETGQPDLEEIHLERVREMYRLAARVGDKLWPGFQPEKIPLLLNYEDRFELLFNQGDPPPGFKPLKGYRLVDKPVFYRDGFSRYGFLGLGHPWRIGDNVVIYMALADPKRGTEDYISIFLHECFHLHQAAIKTKNIGSTREIPIYDVEQAGGVALENAVLYEALLQKDLENMKRLVKTFLAVRSQRRSGLHADIVIQEDFENLREGTAQYVQVRLFQLLADTGAGPSPLQGKDPYYNAFKDSRRDFCAHIDRVHPSPDALVTMENHIYQNGMAQAFLLDRLREGWKKECFREGKTQFELLQELFPLEEQEMIELVEQAKERFDYPTLLAQQEKLVNRHLSGIKEFLNSKSRRYRLHHGMIRELFRWKGRKPLLVIPRELWPRENKLNHFGLIYRRGIEIFEKSGLVFKTAEIPVLFRGDYLEWHPPGQGDDFANLEVKAGKHEQDIYEDLSLSGESFSLTLSKCRIESSGGLVDIFPLVEKPVKK